MDFAQLKRELEAKKELKAAAGDIPCVIIGDAVKPGKVDQATRGAYLAAIGI